MVPGPVTRLAAVLRSPTALRIVLIAALASLATACGGKVVAPTADTVVGTVPGQTSTVTETVPAAYANGDPAAGKPIFASKGCTACHTLKDAGATGTVGPNLDTVTPPPSLSLAVDRVTHGAGAMPPFKGQLSTKQIADVTAYVVHATGGNPNG